MTGEYPRVPVKYVASYNDETLPEVFDAVAEIDYIEISDVDGDRGITNSTTLKFADAPSRARRRVRANDVLVSTVRTYLRAIASAEPDHDGFIASTGFCVLRPTKVHPRFLKYAASSYEFVEGIIARSTGVSYPAINATDLVRLPVPMPSADKQGHIAKFLDRETARIDDLIGKQERLIELLAERRRATINEAYAREAAPAKLRHVVQFAQTGPFGTQLSAEEYVDDGVPVINPTHIRKGEITPDLTISVTPGKAAELARHRLMKGDIILGRKGEVDKSARAIDDNEGFVCGSDSMLLRPKASTDSDYLWWFFQSPKAHAQLELWSVGSTVAGLNQITMSKIRLPLPSLAEQRAVARLLADATSKIDRLIEKAAESVVLLRERRAALISAAVTGKINVSNEGVAA